MRVLCLPKIIFCGKFSSVKAEGMGSGQFLCSMSFCYGVHSMPLALFADSQVALHYQLHLPHGGAHSQPVYGAGPGTGIQKPLLVAPCT